ncbi:hypothetical protein HU200_036298 [Digitaria exilis]|uniref:Thaumatin-like protein n=1 Tax=Digitaria exilis TaxID=1010633 RepID=A0A835EM06_9POAL|nr:hypothetical protein HU200_036298 [Digitaria exilis]
MHVVVKASLLLPLLPILLLVATNDAATIIVTNNCSFTVWPAATPVGGGVQLDQGQTWTIGIPAGTSESPMNAYGGAQAASAPATGHAKQATAKECFPALRAASHQSRLQSSQSVAQRISSISPSSTVSAYLWPYCRPRNSQGAVWCYAAKETPPPRHSAQMATSVQMTKKLTPAQGTPTTRLSSVPQVI